jgi:hypothetical protein
MPINKDQATAEAYGKKKPTNQKEVKAPAGKNEKKTIGGRK